MTTETKAKTIVRSFGIEADAPRNNDLILQSIPGCRLRGAISPSKHVIDAKTGEAKIPQDQSRHLGQLPPIPGMCLHVNPAEGAYVIIDPLHDDEEMCERIRLNLENTTAYRSNKKLNGVAPQKGVLDPHRMKTLCREMINLVEANEAKVVKGSLPKMEEVDALPGNYLLNPGSRVGNTQPRYEKDYEEWIGQLTRSGG